jgi:hypothetical protein
MITEELLKYKKISKNIFCLGILNLIVLISFIIINNNIYGFYNILLKIFGDEALIAFFLYLPLFSFFVFYFALFLLAQIGISIFLFFKGLKKEALLNIIIFLLLAGFFFVYIINEKVNPNSRTNTYNQVAENKYQELENLFNNILDIQVTLPFWTRNMCKFGDTFLYLQTEVDKGIVGARMLNSSPYNGIERKDTLDTRTGKSKTVFKWVQKNEEFTLWQIAHFRLFGDIKFLPYGSSVFAGVRQYWRMIRMAEDAMLVYRATRASERRIVKVNVGNSDPNDIKNIIQSVASGFKRTQIVDQATGNINYKFQPASIEQDIFIPVRSDNATNPIETLAGASNLSDIEDISMLRSNLVTGLGIPMSFLTYAGEGAADSGGKALSTLDVRFARKVNKIQQAMISELNRIAIIHLVMLGYEDDDIRDFKLTLANPSTQGELLKLELWEKRVDLYTKLTTATETGVKPMSETNAKKQVLNMSDDEIIQDLKQQLIENVVGEEIKNASLVIKNSGLFTELQKYFTAGVLNKEELLQKINNPVGAEDQNLTGGAGNENTLGTETEAGGEQGGGSELPDLNLPETPATQLQESLNKKKKKNEGLKPKRLIINSNAKNTPQEEIITKGFKINEELQNLLNGLNDFKDKEENK